MAGVGRLHLPRRRQSPNWMRVLVMAILALVGGAALWNGLQYSTSHEHSFVAQLPIARQDLGGTFEEEPAAAVDPKGGQRGGKGDAIANLAAWTEVTSDLPGVQGGGEGSSGGSSGAGGGATQQAGGGKGATTVADDRKGFVTVQLRVPKMPPTYNSWVQTEDMLLFHLRALQQQLEQVYIGMALAAAAGRAFVLPEFSCFCQNSAAPLPRCRRPDADKLQFPATCREGDVLVPVEQFAAGGGNRGMPLDVRPANFLQSLESAGGQDAELLLRPSAQILFPKCKEIPRGDSSAPDTCMVKSSREGEGEAVLLVPPSLNDTDLLPLLAPLSKYVLWRLDFSDIGSHWHAFAGWDCTEPANQFDLRMSTAVKPWPSPHAAAAAAASGEAPSGDAAMLSMSMTSGRTYSDEPDMRQCGSTGGAAAMVTRR